MKTLRYTAAAATILMSLMNLPFAFHDGDADLARPVAWLITLLGVAGLAVAVGLLRKATWAPLATTGVGLVNLAGAVLAAVRGQDGAVVGLVVSIVITLLSLLIGRRQ